jgi:hypothetical protein
MPDPAESWKIALRALEQCLSKAVARSGTTRIVGIRCHIFVSDLESRNAMLQAVSDDHNNALGKYAAKNSTTARDVTSELKN